MKGIRLGGTFPVSSIALGCMRMASLTEEEADFRYRGFGLRGNPLSFAA